MENNIRYGISIPANLPIEALQLDIGIYKVEEDGTTTLLTFEETVDAQLVLRGKQVVWLPETQVIKIDPNAQLGDTYIVLLIHSYIDEELGPVEKIVSTVAVRIVQGTPLPPVTDANIEIHSLRDIEGIDIKTGELIKAEKFFFPLTHIKAVIDDKGNTLYGLLQILQDNIDDAVTQFNNRIDQITSGEVQVNSISISPEVQKLGVGKATLIIPNILPVYASHKQLQWETSNDTVATVTNGTVRGMAKGTCVIRATTLDGTNLSATCTINVVLQVQQILVPSNVTIEKAGDTYQLTPTIIPLNVEDPTLLYNVTDDNIASVDETGKITAIADAGITRVVITSRDGGAQAFTNVTVGTLIPVESVEFNEGAAGEIFAGESKTLTTKILPLNATTKALTWRSEDNSIATVAPILPQSTSCKITGINGGTCEIIAKTTDGSELEAHFTVTVVPRNIYYGTSMNTLEYPTSASEMTAQKSTAFNGVIATIPEEPGEDFRTFWVAIPQELIIESWKETTFHTDREYFMSTTTITQGEDTYTVYYVTSTGLIAGDNEEVKITAI